MWLNDAPVVDVREPLTRQRERLLALLDSLEPGQWAAATAVPRWSVKDIALHLVDVDLSWLARHRDHDQSGSLAPPSGHQEFVGRLADRNQQWIDGAQVLSPPLITAMLRWAGQSPRITWMEMIVARASKFSKLSRRSSIVASISACSSKSPTAGTGTP